MAAASGYPVATAGVCIGHPNRLMSERFPLGRQCYYGRVSMRLKNWRLVRSGSKNACRTGGRNRTGLRPSVSLQAQAERNERARCNKARRRIDRRRAKQLNPAQ